MGALAQGSLTEGSGDTTAYTAVSASDTFINTPGMTILAVDNQSGGNCTVGAAAQVASTTKQGFGNLTKGNVSVVCPTGQTTIIGTFSHSYNFSNLAKNKLSDKISFYKIKSHSARILQIL